MCVIEILEVHTHGTKVRFRLLTSEKTTLLTSRSTASLQHGLSVMGGQSSPWHVLSVFVGLHVLITKYKCGWIPSFTGPEGSSEWEILYSCDYLQVQVIASQKLNFLHLFVQLFRSHVLFFFTPSSQANTHVQTSLFCSHDHVFGHLWSRYHIYCLKVVEGRSR